MLILLPPSEGKTPAPDGSPVDPSSLWLPALAAARTRVLKKLVALCARTSERSIADSLAVLGLSDGQRGEIARNAELLTAPAAAAAQVYTGVLYEALGATELRGAEKDWLDRTAVVFSGLWGVVRLGDAIPAYRCSVGVTLPGIGGLTPYWKKGLKKVLDEATAEAPVLDLRSGAYAAMWAPGPNAAALRVLHERVVGGVAKRSVVSHFNKATKGRLVRALAVEQAAPGSVDELVTALRDLKFTIEEQPGPAGGPRRLDVIVTEL
ncbi:peroxide stress protein YaaA [Actinoplanes sichuanensis]|uniref:Peroxide stress protein YaaA n=1 Tax=Actinoplanes sichuanensis TaxID=512349 RepID=A0ABW4AF05_9ACTN|nr:peroxide stress protein YaaA [Actinoplanes sichuanensis]BEL02759.1 peroxide stress protein YaaA [Actinoplanes sichuanensis]